MAFLIPENLPTSADVPAAVQSVAKAFRDWLDDDVTVWLEHDGADEPYLVVFDPAAGVLVLDVRGGGAKGLGGASGSLLRRRKAPTLEELTGRLRDRETSVAARLDAEQRLPDGVAVVSSVAVPALDRAAAEKLGFGKADVDGALLKEDFTERAIVGALRRVLAGDLDATLDDNERQIVRGILKPEIIISGGHDDGDAGQLVFAPPETGAEDVIRVLDREQERLAAHLGGGYRVIKGVAGSGKSLVLTFRARQLAESFPQWRILLACFNVCLSKALQSQLADVPNVDVKTVDSVANGVLSGARVRVDTKQPDGWTVLRTRALEVARKPTTNSKYDVVLVDEGQDLEPLQLDFLHAMLKPGKEDLILALDAAQDIYRKRSRWNPPDQTARGRTTVLKRNYRNTREILEFAWRFLTRDGDLGKDELVDDLTVIVPPEATSRRGPQPTVLQCPDAKAEVDVVVERLERAHADGTPWGSMAVLFGSPKHVQGRLYAECNARKIPYLFVSMNTHTKRDVVAAGDVVRASNVWAIKGLEFSRVFLCAVNEFAALGGDVDLQGLRKLAYVGMTRAMDELTVTVSGTGPLGQDIQAAAR